MDLVSTNLIYSSISHLFYCNLLRILNNYNYHRIEYYFRKRVKSSRKITISDFSLQQLSYDSWIVDFFRSERWNVSRMVTVFRDVGKVGGKGAAAADNYPHSYPHPRLYRYIRPRFLISQMERTVCSVDSYRSRPIPRFPDRFYSWKYFKFQWWTKFAGSLFPPRFRNYIYTHTFYRKHPEYRFSTRWIEYFQINRKFYPKINSIIRRFEFIAQRVPNSSLWSAHTTVHHPRKEIL